MAMLGTSTSLSCGNCAWLASIAELSLSRVVSD